MSLCAHHAPVYCRLLDYRGAEVQELVGEIALDFLVLLFAKDAKMICKTNHFACLSLMRLRLQLNFSQTPENFAHRIRVKRLKKKLKKNNEEIKTRSQRYTRGKQNTLG